MLIFRLTMTMTVKAIKRTRKTIDDVFDVWRAAFIVEHMVCIVGIERIIDDGMVG